MLNSILDSQLLSALVGGLLSGLLTFIATWWTLKKGFTNQIKVLEDDLHEKQRGAGWALIAEMSENLARLQTLSSLAKENAPVANLVQNLKLNRYVFDRQLPLISLRLGLEDLRVVTAAYAGVSNLFGILQGKWHWAANDSPPSEQDAKSIVYAADDYEKALRTIGKIILAPEELRTSGLE
ncbi:MAG: hypothetical protein WAU82_17930 [Candidatus Binatus sp.]|uniref:hypothetical protein n=1 Tax=Candidatus Binatus sp. TaxID=2811406 RepID=UPI003BAE7465